MQMNDEQLLVLLLKIKERCTDIGGFDCDGCPFDDGVSCQIHELFKELNDSPYYWKLERIKEIIER